MANIRWGALPIRPRKNQHLTLPAHGFKQEFEAYLEHLDESKVRSLEQLIQFNKDNAEQELPPRKSASGAGYAS